jgi:hypothetical protein
MRKPPACRKKRRAELQPPGGRTLREGHDFSRAVMAALSFCHSEGLQSRGIDFPRGLPPARDCERRSSIGTAEAVPFPTPARTRALSARLKPCPSQNRREREFLSARLKACPERSRRAVPFPTPARTRVLLPDTILLRFVSGHIHACRYDLLTRLRANQAQLRNRCTLAISRGQKKGCRLSLHPV